MNVVVIEIFAKQDEHYGAIRFDLISRIFLVHMICIDSGKAKCHLETEISIHGLVFPVSLLSLCTAKYVNHYKVHALLEELISNSQVSSTAISSRSIDCMIVNMITSKMVKQKIFRYLTDTPFDAASC